MTGKLLGPCQNLRRDRERQQRFADQRNPTGSSAIISCLSAGGP
jgi:hypothetical protein